MSETRHRRTASDVLANVRGGARPAAARVTAPEGKRDGDSPPRAEAGAFSSFFERNALMARRRKSRRRTLVVSVAVHVVVLGGLVVYSLWHVDELFGRNVEVKIFSPAQTPPGVFTPAPTNR